MNDILTMNIANHIKQILSSILSFLFIFSSLEFNAGCVRGTTQDVKSETNLIPPQVREKVREVEPCVIGVAGVFDYDNEIFRHVLVNGKYILDTTSLTGYRLVEGAAGIARSHRIEENRGAGLILFQDNRRSLILTTRHIIFSPDTSYSYARDTAGIATDVLFSRSIKTQSSYHVIDEGNRLKVADVIYTDARSDLGLLLVTTPAPIGLPYPYTIAYATDVDWGDQAFVFGYPRGIKQLTLGVISHSPYPGSFTIDIVARSGYSGGPIFVAQPDGRLELAGIIRAVPVNKLYYVSPPPDVMTGQFMTERMIMESKAEESDMIDYGIAYAVGASKIGRFLEESVPYLDKLGINLPSQFLPKK